MLTVAQRYLPLSIWAADGTATSPGHLWQQSVHQLAKDALALHRLSAVCSVICYCAVVRYICEVRSAGSRVFQLRQKNYGKAHSLLCRVWISNLKLACQTSIWAPAYIFAIAIIWSGLEQWTEGKQYECVETTVMSWCILSQWTCLIGWGFILYMCVICVCALTIGSFSEF